MKAQERNAEKTLRLAERYGTDATKLTHILKGKTMRDLLIKVFNPDHDLVGAFAYYEDAACVVALYGAGATIRVYGETVWLEGSETQEAAESYDYVREVCITRLSKARSS